MILKENSSYKPLWCIFLVLVVLCMGSISALEWDNTKSYDENTKEVTIDNMFGLPLIGTTIAKIKLLTPINNIVPRGYGKVAEFELTLFNDYNEAFKELELYNLEDGNEKFERDFDYKYLTNVEADVNDYKEVCTPTFDVKNISHTEDCTMEIIGIHKETKEQWIKLENYDFNDKDVLRIGIFTDVQVGDQVEWIPNFFGVRIDEWAEWTESMNVGLRIYLNGSSLVDSIGNQNAENGLGAPTFITAGCLLNSCIQVGNTSNFKLTNSTNTYGLDSRVGKAISINFWVKLVDSENNDRVMQSGTTNYAKVMQVSGTDVKAEDGFVNSAYTMPIADGGGWEMITYIKNESNYYWLYHNATLQKEGIYGGWSEGGTYLDSSISFGYSISSGASAITDASFDEIGIWNRDLTSSEVTDLYNSGAGLTYSIKVKSLTANASYPIDYFNTTDNTLTLACNFTSAEQNITSVKVNVTLSGVQAYTETTDNADATSYNATWTTSALTNGTYVWDCTGYGSEGINDTTTSRTFSIDLSPTITLKSPVDYYNSSATVDDFLFNITYGGDDWVNLTFVVWNSTDDEVKNRFWVNGTSDVDCSVTNEDGTYAEIECIGQRISNDDTYEWNVYGCNSEDLCAWATSNYTFTVDATPPTINITYPTSDISDDFVSANNKTIYLNWTTSDTNLDTCWYYNNTANVTVTCGDNATFYLPYGTYTHIVYANDSVYNNASDSETITYSYKLLKNSENYTTSVTENSAQDFTMNVSYNSTKYPIVTANLYYNGTSYSSTPSATGGSTTFTRNLIIPSQPTTQNVSFKWLFYLTNASGTVNFNSTVNNQTVNRINASLVGAPYTTNFINFTVYDQETLAQLNVTFSGTINYGISSLIRTFSYEDTAENLSTFSFGFSPVHDSFLVEGEIQAGAEGYVTQLYTLPSQTLTNVTTNISLYLLNSTDSTSFIVKVRDSSYASVVGAVVHVQRYYPGTDTWTTTEILTTNSEGKALGHFYVEDVSYRFLVYVDGVLELTSTSTKIFCEVSPCTITLTLPGGIPYVSYENLTGLDYTLSYSTTTETFTYSYEDSNVSAEGGRLIVVRGSFGNYTQETICDTSSANAIAIITCDISGEINGTYYGFAYNNRSSVQVLVNTLIIQKTRDIVTQIGTDGLIWTFFLILGIVMVGLYKPAVAITITIGGVIFIGILGLASIPIVSIIAIIIMGGFLLWSMRG